MRFISADRKTRIFLSIAAVLIFAAAVIAFVFSLRALFITNKTESETMSDASLMVREALISNEIHRAELLCKQYEYDEAISILEKYDTDKTREALENIKSEKSKLIPADLYEIPHVFFHSLIADTSKAFDGDSKEAGYNQVMTTIAEFRAILSQMYEKGYVLVSLHDIAEKQPDGTFKAGNIMLPEGKRPFVLSVDDVCYYEYMEGDGFASRIVIGDDGRPTCAMKQGDGSFTNGEYDVVPILDAFVREHPDFSYKGAKGILAFTGYNGIMGYRTCPSYSDSPTYNDDCENAKKVAEALRRDGWEFASHSWGHRNMRTMKFENLKTDSERWKNEVESIIGDTDILIFPFGADISDWHKYSEANERFAYLKSMGFDYFCNVDSSKAWLQIGKNYVRQGRRNLDGYRMYYDMINDRKDYLSDLFDVNTVFDKSRPVPVPQM